MGRDDGDEIVSRLSSRDDLFDRVTQLQGKLDRLEEHDLLELHVLHKEIAELKQGNKEFLIRLNNRTREIGILENELKDAQGANFSKDYIECCNKKRELRAQCESLASLNGKYLEKIKSLESRNLGLMEALERVKREVLAAFGIGGDCEV